MAEDATDTLVAVVPPLLQGLEALNFAMRYLDPEHLGDLIEVLTQRGDALRAIEPVWSDDVAPIGAMIDAARAHVLAACDEIASVRESGDMRNIFRAMRHLPRANEALFPLAPGLGPINRHFLPPELRDEEAVQQRVMGPPPRDDVGVFHIDNDPGSRGGFSLYVPEFYTPEEALPLVVAMHGGSGNGRDFLWSWLRDARGYGAIVVAPTAVGQTWALQTEDVDTPNLIRILRGVSSNWSIDTSRMLMTGLSDGGTFSYVSGLEVLSPFTHLAPVAASFHPMLAAAADPDRIRDLPIFLVHGVRDWMFDIEIAREANREIGRAHV